MVDADYVLFACGLLAEVEPEAALRLARTHIRELETKTGRNDGRNSAA